MVDRLLLYKYKGNRCEYCNLGVEETLRRFQTFREFEFNHIDPAKKSPDYDNLMKRKSLTSEHFDEADKCALLCSNCHKILHGQNITQEVVFTLSAVGIEPIRHVLQCQVIFDFEKQEAYLFSDKFPFLDLYQVQIGIDQPKVMSGIQLEPLLAPLIERTKTDGPLIVSLFKSGTVVFSAKCTNETQCEITGKPEFPLVKGNVPLKSEDGGLDFFFRSGSIVSTGDFQMFVETLGRATYTVVVPYQSDSQR